MSFEGVKCCAYNSEVVTDLAQAKYIRFIVKSFDKQDYDLDSESDVEKKFQLSNGESALKAEAFKSWQAFESWH